MTAQAAAAGRRRTRGVGAAPAPLLLTLPVLAYLAVLVLYPLWGLLETAFTDATGWTVRYALDVLTAPGLLTATRNSLVVAFSVTILATALGSGLAWLMARTDVPGIGLLRAALLIPFVIPPFVGAIAWLQLLGGAGWINQLARNLPFVQGTLWNVRSEAGIIFVLVLTSYPLAYVSVLGAFNRLDPSMEEAARVSGAGIGRMLKDVTGPVMRPAIASGGVLVFIYAMANFGVPAVLGFTQNFYVLTTRIYALIGRAAQPGALNQAAAMSLLLGVIALISIVLQRIGEGRTRRLSERSSPNVPLKLGRSRIPLAIAAWIVVLVAGALPVAAILLSSLTVSPGRLPLPGNLTTDNYVAAIALNDATLRGIRNSLVLGFLAALLVTGFGAIIAYLARRTSLPGRNLIDALATLPFALPGTVVGVGILLAFIVPIGPILLFNTLWIILAAYLMHYMAYGIRATGGALALMDPSLEEASRACGATATGTFWRIVVPLLRPALFGGFFLVFIPTIRELTISVLLWSPGNETVGVVVFNLQESGETQVAAAVAFLLIVTVGVMNFASRRISGGRIGY